MGNVYSRFIDRRGARQGSELWAEGESFSVRRAPVGVNYGRTIGDFEPSTSLLDPPTTQTEASMATQAGQLPPMPEIGRPESYYADLIRSADRNGSMHLREAAKVGQYITLGLDPSLAWNEKLRYFQHAHKRHCSPPPYPDDAVWMFYQNLADLVRSWCGAEALRLAGIEDDLYAARLKMGQSRDRIEDDAERFFMNLLGSNDRCPEWFNENEWLQLKLLRDQWI
jgi:hypothetical protein